LAAEVEKGVYKADLVSKRLLQTALLLTVVKDIPITLMVAQRLFGSKLMVMLLTQ
jgi:hypothetical protein